MERINVYIVHGYKASPADHWFQWLKRELKGHGIVSKVITLPNSSSPNPDIWHNTLATNIPILSENTFIVAHSLGGVSTLRYLQAQNSKKTIGGLILVSPFSSQLPGLPQLDAFTKEHIDYEKVMKMVGKKAVMASPQDPIVPYAFSQEVVDKFQAKLYPINDAGHFLAENGYDKFPQLLELLLGMTAR